MSLKKTLLEQFDDIVSLTKKFADKNIKDIRNRKNSQIITRDFFEKNILPSFEKKLNNKDLRKQFNIIYKGINKFFNAKIQEFVYKGQKITRDDLDNMIIEFRQDLGSISKPAEDRKIEYNKILDQLEDSSSLEVSTSEVRIGKNNYISNLIIETDVGDFTFDYGPVSLARIDSIKDYYSMLTNDIYLLKNLSNELSISTNYYNLRKNKKNNIK